MRSHISEIVDVTLWHSGPTWKTSLHCRFIWELHIQDGWIFLWL